MFFYHPFFWLGALFVFLYWSRRRRWSRRWAMSGPPGYAQNSPVGWNWRHATRHEEWTGAPQPAAPRPLSEPDAALVESLESRIAGLEQRLEFAERMLAERGPTSPKA